MPAPVETQPKTGPTHATATDRASSIATTLRQQLHGRAALLSVIIAVGALLRIWMMARANWMFDADEAILGIMGNHIRQGERPIFFYGQAYMGSLQAYVAALSYELFGMSRASFKLITVPEFIAFALSIYALARRTYSANVAVVATLLAAVPPVYVLSITSKILGPLLISITVGNLILLLTIDEAYGVRPTRRPAVRLFVIGLLGGFGFWLHGQTMIYLATAALLLFLADKRIIIRPRALAAIAGFIVGAAPVFRFAMNHEYTTFHHLLGIGADDVKRRYVDTAMHYFQEVVPQIAGIMSPWTPMPDIIQIPIALIIGGAIISLLVRRYRGLLGWLRLSLAPGEPTDALILFGIVTSAAFVLSNFGNLALEYPQFDASGRYAIPLVSILPIIIAGEIMRLDRFSRPLAAVALVILLLGSSYTYLRTEPSDLWQSPYWRRLPESNSELIAALDDLGAEAVWMNHWVGKTVIFDTQERISTADFYDLWVGGVDRLADHTNRVRATERAAFAFRTEQDRVPLEKWLTAQGIAYDKRVVRDFVVLRPQQHVDPHDVVDYLGYDY